MSDAAAVDLAISTPGDWVVVDAETLEFDGTTAAVGDRLAAVPELASYADALAGAVGEASELVRDDGVLFAAVLADVDERRPVIANLIVARTDQPSAEVRAEAVAADQMGPDEAQEDGDPVARALAAAATEEGVQQRVANTVLLGGGPALRVARLKTVPLTPQGPELTLLTVQYYFTPSGLADAFLVQFSTPSVQFHEELQQLFHAIAETVRISG